MQFIQSHYTLLITIFIIVLFLFLRKRIKFYFLTKELEQLNKIQFKNANELKKQIIVEMRKFLGFDKKSKFIPPSYKDRVLTVNHIHLRYGEQMKQYNVKLTTDLTFK